MTDLDAADFDAFLAFAHDLADRSAATILPHFRARGDVDHKPGKGPFDPVTAADRAAERLIRAAVAERWPSHAVLGEEFGHQPGEGGGAEEFCWIVDPIDGTRSFITGTPVWGTLIGLNRRGTPVLGLMNQPFTGERFWSGSRTARYKGPDGELVMNTRPCSALAAATLLSTGPDMFAQAADLERFELLSARVQLRRYGGDCYGYCMLAAGHADLVVESGLAIHDIAPLIPIIERAGGQVTTWDGASAAQGGRIIASGDARVHEAALKILAG